MPIDPDMMKAVEAEEERRKLKDPERVERDDETCTGCRGTGYDPNRERACDCADGIILQEIDNRDAWADAFGKLYALIMGDVPEWSNLYGISDALQDAERALSAELRGLAGVKPLKWMEGGFEQDADLVDTTETYQIQEGIFWYGCQVDGTRCEDNEAAKAAAQAHHDARVRAMLADPKGG